MKRPKHKVRLRQLQTMGAWRLGAPLQARRAGLAIIVALAAGVVVTAIAVSIPAKSVSGAVDRLDFASKLLTVVGLLGGLTWALFKLVVSPEGFVDEIGQKTYSNLKVDLTCETVAYRDDLRVATFVVVLENVGSIPIRAGTPGCTLSVSEVPDDLPAGATVPDIAGLPLVDDHNLLARYDSNSSYVIGPGVTYQESESVVMDAQRLVSARATFHFGELNEDAQTEYRLFRIE